MSAEPLIPHWRQSGFGECDNCGHGASAHDYNMGACLSVNEGQAGMYQGYCGCDQLENAAASANRRRLAWERYMAENDPPSNGEAL
ncbi:MULTISPECIES: hypothetical protein [Mycobacteroides]|uniref:hypothetical protein n=1 Tax=Mycobacteroides TaxID=670516 RepID=UPI001041BA2E|nr:MULTISPECIES: hypothetical protein [Mycobacteroides]MDM2383836.1 hypothetical protein [Mycobacteroides abscessus]MDM2387302.1 hypothetical protein [Mycobacteroides abscessus]